MLFPFSKNDGIGFLSHKISIIFTLYIFYGETSDYGPPSTASYTEYS